MNGGSLKKQVAVRFFVVVLLTLVLLEGVFFVAARQFYYSSIVNVLTNHAKLTASFYNKYSGEVAVRNLSGQLNGMLQQFAHPSAELQLVAAGGQLLASSSGFSSSRPINAEDVDEAFRTADRAVWNGKQPETGEHIMAVSIPQLESGQPFLVLRYVTSLESIDRLLRSIYSISAAIGLAVLGIVLTVSLSLARSIVRPIQSITAASSQMASGEFGVQVQETGPAEIRELARTLNYMASEIRRTEKLKQDFISSISHEIRTPISGIKGWSETILTGDMEDKQETRLGLDIISKETDRLIGLVEELLDFSRLHEKRIVLELTRVDPAELLEQVIVQLKAKADAKRIRLLARLDEAPRQLDADGNRLRQVFLNLLDNAIKYSSAGGKVEVTAREADGAALIHVRDEGIGITPDHLPHVTEKFYQADPRTEGTGIGLAICKEIVELHGGELKLDSEPGAGTSVTVRLPVAPAEHRLEEGV